MYSMAVSLLQHGSQSRPAPPGEALAAISPLDPLLPAEALDLDEVQNYYTSVGAALVNYPAQALNAEISRLVETSLSPEVDLSEGDKYLEYTSGYIQQLCDDETAPFLEVTDAALMEIFAPAFNSRRRPEVTLGRSTMQDLYLAQSDLLCELEEENMPGRNREGIAARLALLAIGTRNAAQSKAPERLIYPASVRECRNGGINHHLNHNAYRFNGNQKTPLRTRYPEVARNHPSPDILALSFSGLVRTTGRKLHARHVKPRDVLRFIERETDGKNLGTLALDFLDTLGDEVQQQIDDFQQSRANGDY